MNPEISIVIPTLNEADSIAETLDALTRFAGNTKIIVVDSGSVDATVDCRKLRRKNSALGARARAAVANRRKCGAR